MVISVALVTDHMSLFLHTQTHTLSDPHSLPSTMCDVELVAHGQAPHFASDTGGDALPPQVSHSSRCAPEGGVGCGKKVQYVRKRSSQYSAHCDITINAKNV